MNWPIIMPVRGGLAHTKAAIKSALTQTVTTRLYISNNSVLEDPKLTTYLLELEVADPRVTVIANEPRLCVAASWNQWLCQLFGRGEPWALVVNSDVKLHPQTYEALVKTGAPFITGVGVRLKRGKILEPPDLATPLRSHPDFSCFLVRREAFIRVGLFDEAFWPAYMEDWDYHRRMKLAGVPAMQANIPFIHLARSVGRSREIAKDLEYRRVTNQYYVGKWGAPWPDETLTIPFGWS